MATSTAPHFVWDMIVPLAPEVGNDWDALLRYHAAGHGYVSLTAAGDDSGLGVAMHRIADFRRQIAMRGQTLRLATSVADIRAAHRQGKLAVGLHLEGTECLERDPNAIDLMYALGVRHANLAFNRNNSAAGGCADLGNVGLSRLGRRYVERMNEVGMLIDLSHTSERASLEAIDASGAPVIFSHSNAQALHPHYRNITDAQARACAATGGLVGLSGSSAYLGGSAPLVEAFFRHLDHFVQLLGARHVGIGTDYVVDGPTVSRIFRERPDEWPTERNEPHEDVRYLPPEELADVVARMVRAGYGEAAITDILGENYARICGPIWT